MESPTREVSAELVESEIKADMEDYLAKAQEIADRVKDPEGRAEAVEVGVRLKTKLLMLESKREKYYGPAYRLAESLRELFDPRIRTAKALIKLLGSAISSYDLEVERKERIAREELERKRREEQAAYEKALREREAEIKRQEEALKAEIAAKKKAEDDLRLERERKIKQEEDARIAQAEEAKKQGNLDRVDHILEKTTAIAPEQPRIEAVAPPAPPRALPPPPPPPAPAPLPPVVAKRPDENTSKMETWKFSVDNLYALVKAVAENRAPIEYLEASSVIGKDLRKLKDEFKCDGVRTWKERTTSFKV